MSHKQPDWHDLRAVMALDLRLGDLVETMDGLALFMGRGEYDLQPFNDGGIVWSPCGPKFFFLIGRSIDYFWAARIVQRA